MVGPSVDIGNLDGFPIKSRYHEKFGCVEKNATLVRFPISSRERWIADRSMQIFVKLLIFFYYIKVSSPTNRCVVLKNQQDFFSIKVKNKEDTVLPFFPPFERGN